VTQDRNDHRIAEDKRTLQALPVRGRGGGTAVAVVLIGSG